MIRVSIIGIVGLPANYGGFESFVEQLVRRISNDILLTVYCSAGSYTERQQEYFGARLKYLPLRANGWQSIFYDGAAMLDALRDSDVIFVLGVSGSVWFPLVRMLSDILGRKLIVHLDGLEWKRSKWGNISRSFLRFSESIAVKFAHIPVTDNKAVAQYISDRYRRFPEVIEYGGDHVLQVQSPERCENSGIDLFDKYAVAVSRAEPENNVELILEAFKNLPEHNLVYVSNWKHSRWSRELKEKYKDVPNIKMIGPIYDQRVLNCIRSRASVYVHGHSVGGTNPSLVEAMWLGLPVIAYDVPFNRCVTENAALYFSTREGLVQIVKTLDKECLCQNAARMLQIAKRRFTWDRVVTEYEKLFNGIHKVDDSIPGTTPRHKRKSDAQRDNPHTK